MDCSNHLRVEGSKEDIERFVSQAGEGVFFLRHFIPMPVEYGHTYDEVCPTKEASALLILKYGFDDVDKWCLANWGTLFDEGESNYDEQTHSFGFRRDCPPVIAIIRISLLYPDLKIFYEYKINKISAEDMQEYPDMDSNDKSLLECLRKSRKYPIQKGLLKHFGKWGKYIIQNGWVEHEEYKKQNKGKLAGWIKHIREEDKKIKHIREKDKKIIENAYRGGTKDKTLLRKLPKA